MLRQTKWPDRQASLGRKAVVQDRCANAVEPARGERFGQRCGIEIVAAGEQAVMKKFQHSSGPVFDRERWFEAGSQIIDQSPVIERRCQQFCVGCDPAGNLRGDEK